MKPIDSTIGKSIAPYPGIYGRILFNKGCRSLCRFSPIDWSCLYRGTCGAACEYVPTGLGLVGLYSHPRKSSFVALGLVLTLLPSSQLMSVVGNLLYMGLAVMGGLWMPISLFPEWMQAIGKCLPTYQLMELIKTFLNKGQVNGFASLYLALFTLVLFALVIVYRRHSEVRS